MLARSFLIKSSGKLLVTRTGIKAQSSSILGQIRPLILELLALEWRKFHTFELEYLWSQLANLDQILCVASLGWGKGCIRFWGRLTLAHWTQVSDRCPLGYLLHKLCFRENYSLNSREGVLFTPVLLNWTLLSMDFWYWSQLRMRVIGGCDIPFKDFEIFGFIDLAGP